MRENHYLADDVDLQDLAARTPQLSGAEIAGVVRLAASYALDRKVKIYYLILDGAFHNSTMLP
jgi:vesicle-fusing ATPase